MDVMCLTVSVSHRSRVNIGVIFQYHPLHLFPWRRVSLETFQSEQTECEEFFRLVLSVAFLSEGRELESKVTFLGTTTRRSCSCLR